MKGIGAIVRFALCDVLRDCDVDMVALVEQMLDLHKRLAAAAIPEDRALYERQIAATETPTLAPTRTFTPPPTPTYTPTPTATFTPTPTETAIPKPTNAPTARPKKTATPTPVAYPPPVLLTPTDQHVCWRQPPHPGPTYEFTWSWDGVLKPNEYFQLQLIGPNGEHWGVHAPTKDPFHTYTYDRWKPWRVAEWCGGSGACHALWTVIVVEWDGVDTKLGRVLAEAAPRYIAI